MFLSAVQTAKRIRNGSLSCFEVMQGYLSRIDLLNAQHTAIVNLADHSQLLAQAAAADKRLAAGEYDGWMHGLPHAIKDLANTKGFVTSFGSPIFASQIAEIDDLFVGRIKQAGAIIIGKTNVPEFGLGSQSYNRVFGTTKNAFDPGLTAGGSSGGAAAALALGLSAVADGSDMMGSLRNPAAFNNVVSLRPGLGRVPSLKEDVFFNQLSTDGPMARTVEDLIYLYCTMAGPHRSAPLSHQGLLPDTSAFKKAEIKGKKIAWLGNFDSYLPMQPGVLELCTQALEQLSAAGVQVDDRLPKFSMESLWSAWLTLRHWQVAFNPAFHDPANEARLKPELLWELAQSKKVTAADVAAASKVRSAWYQSLVTLFAEYDFLALPSAQVFPFDAKIHWPESIAGVSMDTYHRWMEVVIGASMASVPTLSLPVGFNGHCAMGMQFLAPMGAEQDLLEFALGYEEINPWSQHYNIVRN